MSKINKNNDFKTNPYVDYSKGERTTISSPSKLQSNKKLKILGSNIDALKYSVDINWGVTSIFIERLKDAKKQAEQKKREIPFPVTLGNLTQDYIFNIKEHGSNGYAWILTNNEYSLLIGNWLTPQSRPSVIITIRSETLWRVGASIAGEFIFDLIKQVGGIIIEDKISRLDLCVDTLFPEDIWSEKLMKYKNTRASKSKFHLSHDIFSGFTIGTGKIKARLYDKALEIKEQSHKDWLYDIWGVKEIPNNYRIIRIEFELHREVLKSLDVSSSKDLFKSLINIWAYCTQSWLKFQDHPGKQSHRRKTFNWWQTIQNGFLNCSIGHPLIRVKASNADKEMLISQTIGFMSSLMALEIETNGKARLITNIQDAFKIIDEHQSNKGLNSNDFQKLVSLKIAKYQRLRENEIDAYHQRKKLNLLN